MRPRLLGLLGLSLAAVVLAGGGATARAEAPPSRPHDGWQVGRVRFEPLVDAATLTVAGLGEYRGVIEVGRTGGGLAVLNEVAIDDYLKGLGEMPSSWPTEALRAQAVAARTYLLWDAFSGTRTAYRAAGADICATQSCQVYVGVAKERGPYGERWAQAVADTAGQVLLYQGRLVMAKYSSSNGGRSVPGSRPYLRAVDDPDDAASPLHRWRSALPLDGVRAAFGVVDPLVSVAQAGDVVVLTSQGADGHQAELRVAHGAFRERVNAALPAPAGLPRAVPSARFTVTTAGGSVVVDGRGYGHGIGMSQYGALGKAQRGMKAPDILAAYYGGLRPTQLPPQQLPPSMRVALALDRGAVRVESASPFRVVDEGGAPLAVVTAGAWEVRPGARGVAVVPPPESATPVGIDGIAVRVDEPGTPPVVRFRLSAPARVQVTVSGAGLPPVASPPRLVPAGEVAEPLGVAVPPGDYQVVVQADAGGGRVATAPASFRVGEAGEPVAVDGAAAVPGGRSLTLAADGVPTGGGETPAATATALALMISVGGALAAQVFLEHRRRARLATAAFERPPR